MDIRLYTLVPKQGKSQTRIGPKAVALWSPNQEKSACTELALDIQIGLLEVQTFNENTNILNQNFYWTYNINTGTLTGHTNIRNRDCQQT